ncbi:MAG: methionine--tRNA ligase, partial [Gammaproteobacteria bacterium]|nr:methionine--tRNA ligase [Gammaproteobacteria bacterium]
HYTGRLATWMHSGSLQKEVEHKLREWLDQGLQDWDISRDAPYFGFEIPDAPGKYFYVWLDAPVGYLASFQTLCDRLGLSFQDFWKSESKTELYHFIGKDIMYFHALFWPAVLMSAQYRLPNGVFVHGFVTVNGQKMSKSRGTFITARRYLKHLNPEYLRYYFATKLSGSIEDIDLQLDDFSARVNSDLVGKVVNIASRCAGFIRKSFNNTLSETLLNPALFEEFLSKTHEIKTLYETREYGRAMREIMALADKANQFIELHQPWTLAKTPGQELMTQQVCTQGLNCFRHLIILLKPVLPRLAEEAQAFLNVPDLKWADLTTPLLNHTICDFKPLMTRIDPAQLMALQNDEDSA